MLQYLSMSKSIARRLLFTGIQLLFTGIYSSGYCQTAFQRLYGTMDNDAGYSVTGCSSGGYLIGGSTSNFYTTDPDLYLLRIDENGDTLWTRSYPNPNIWDVNALVMEQMDHAFIVGNNAESEKARISLHKYSDSGTELWTQNYDLADDAYIYSLISTPDTGVVFCGTVGWAEQKVLLFRTDKSGNEIWQRSYGGNFDEDYTGRQVIHTQDNGYMICGFKREGGGTEVRLGMIIKTDTSGVASWIKYYQSTDYYQRFFNDIKQNADGSYIVAGFDATSNYINPGVFPFLRKLNQSGNVVWTKYYNFVKPIQSVFLTNSDQYIVTGASADSAIVAKIDTSGNLLWSSYIVSKYENANLYSAIPTYGDGYMITGSSASTAGYGGTDVLILKANQDGLLTGLHEGNPEVKVKRISISPNPCTEKIEVKCEYDILSLAIFDSKGCCLYQNSPGTYSGGLLTIQADKFPKGLLYLRCITNQGVLSQKFIKF